MRRKKPLSMVVVVSFIIAIVLTLLPMPSWTVWLRPTWVLLVLTYWVMRMPEHINLGTAWLVGLILDVISGTLLGEHALALTVTTFLVLRIYTRLRMHTLMQQSLFMFFLVLINQTILYCVQGFWQSAPHTWLFWTPTITSMLLWPWVYMILRDY